MHRRARVAALCAAAVLGAVLPGLPPLLTAGNALTTDEVYVVPANGVFQVQGHGWGHGHGMSQWGAQGAAQLGKTHGQILDAYYPGTSVGSVPDDWLRVLITADDDADTHVLWEQGLTASDIGRSGYPTVTLPSGHSDWRAIASGSGEQLEYLDSTGWHPYAIGGQLNSVGPIRFGGTTTARVPTVTLVLPGGRTVAYAGLIDAYRPGGGTVVTVVNVRLEDYVRGVVPHEAISSWHPEALEAQAVAARTYASFERAQARAAGDGWDICDSTSCQVYGGNGSTPASTDAATKATAGEVRLYGGKPAFTQFSSSDGGWTVAGSEPYLTAHADPWDGVIPPPENPVHSWSSTLPAAAIEQTWPQLGRLTRIVVTSRDGNGEWGGRVTGVLLDGVDAAGQATSVTTTGFAIYRAYPSDEHGYSDGLFSEWWKIIVTKPSAPRGVYAVATTAGAATVYWAPPSTDGGGGVTGYTVRASPSAPAVSAAGTARSATVTGLTPGTTYRFTVTATNTAGTGPGDTTALLTAPVLGDVHPVGVQRLLDTRRSGGPLGPGAVRTVPIAGHGGVPASGVSAVLVSLVAVNPSAPTFLTAWPAGLPRPAVSTVQAPAGHTVGSLTLVGLGAGGAISVANLAGSTGLLVDVEGWIAAAGDRLAAVTPVRLVDTRSRTGLPGPLGPGATGRIPIVGHGGVPSSATAVLLDVVGVRPTASTYLTAYADGAVRPTASSLDLPAGEVRNGLVVVPLGADGAIRLYNLTGSVDVVADLAGWYAPATGSGVSGELTEAYPTRILDTRQGGLGPLADGAELTVVVRGKGGVPTSGIAAVSVTLTATDVLGGGYLRVWPGGVSEPNVSTLNVLNGETDATSVLVPVGSDGTIRIRAVNTTAQVLVDVLGWSTA